VLLDDDDEIIPVCPMLAATIPVEPSAPPPSSAARRGRRVLDESDSDGNSHEAPTPAARGGGAIDSPSACASAVTPKSLHVGKRSPRRGARTVILLRDSDDDDDDALRAATRRDDQRQALGRAAEPHAPAAAESTPRTRALNPRRTPGADRRAAVSQLCEELAALRSGGARSWLDGPASQRRPRAAVEGAAGSIAMVDLVSTDDEGDARALPAERAAELSDAELSDSLSSGASFIAPSDDDDDDDDDDDGGNESHDEADLHSEADEDEANRPTFCIETIDLTSPDQAPRSSPAVRAPPGSQAPTRSPAPRLAAPAARAPASSARERASERRELVASVPELYARLNRLAFGGRLPSDLAIRWSNTLRRTAGVTKMVTQRAAAGAPARRVALIELATKVLDTPERLESTLLHELCHAATWLLDGQARPPHGPGFWRWANAAMAALPDVGVTTCHSYEIHCRHRFACVECAQPYGRHSKSLDVARHRCGRCRGALRYIGAFEPDGTPVKTRAPSQFATFTKANFANAKRSAGAGATHAQAMALLSEWWRAHKESAHTAGDGSAAAGARRGPADEAAAAEALDIYESSDDAGGDGVDENDGALAAHDVAAGGKAHFAPTTDGTLAPGRAPPNTSIPLSLKVNAVLDAMFAELEI
jgi:predicted SprT family Zn-dependent metalloprotease